MTLFPFVLDTTSLEVDASEAENNNRHSLETSHTLWGSDEEQTNLSKNRTVRLVPLKKVITKYSTRHWQQDSQTTKMDHSLFPLSFAGLWTGSSWSPCGTVSMWSASRWFSRKPCPVKVGPALLGPRSLIMPAFSRRCMLRSIVSVAVCKEVWVLHLNPRTWSRKSDVMTPSPTSSSPSKATGHPCLVIALHRHPRIFQNGKFICWFWVFWRWRPLVPFLRCGQFWSSLDFVVDPGNPKHSLFSLSGAVNWSNHQILWFDVCIAGEVACLQRVGGVISTSLLPTGCSELGINNGTWTNSQNAAISRFVGWGGSSFFYSAGISPFYAGFRRFRCHHAAVALLTL